MSTIKAFGRWLVKPLTSRGATFLACAFTFMATLRVYDGEDRWIVALMTQCTVYCVIVAIREK